MKIVFICSCLEDGRDGVGDYTSRIASALIGQGHQVALVALNDKFVTDNFNGNQQTGNIVLPILRLPAKWRLKDRFIRAKSYIDGFDPDWISLQFVIFGYHSKGLPFGIGSRLAALGKGRHWHIMFHELWIGMALESSVKQRYWGLAQKNIIKSLIRSIKPVVMHTHSALYQAQVSKLGFNAEYLKLFGNIPVNNNVKDNSPNQIHADYLPFILVLFGTIHPGAPVKQFAKDVAAYAGRENLRFLLKIIGRSGPEADHWVNEWKSVGLPVEMLGEQPIEIISQALKSAAIGISTSAYAMIEKSGTVAAMHEHGLPVICVSGPYTPKGIKKPLPVPVLEYKAGNFEECFLKRQVQPLNNDVNAIANQLVECFSRCKL